MLNFEWVIRKMMDHVLKELIGSRKVRKARKAKLLFY